jgi:hypothetical protein
MKYVILSLLLVPVTLSGCQHTSRRLSEDDRALMRELVTVAVSAAVASAVRR